MHQLPIPPAAIRYHLESRNSHDKETAAIRMTPSFSPPLPRPPRRHRGKAKARGPSPGRMQEKHLAQESRWRRPRLALAAMAAGAVSRVILIAGAVLMSVGTPADGSCAGNLRGMMKKCTDPTIIAVEPLQGGLFPSRGSNAFERGSSGILDLLWPDFQI